MPPFCINSMLTTFYREITSYLNFLLVAHFILKRGSPVHGHGYPCHHPEQDNDVTRAAAGGEVVALTPVTPSLVDDGLLLLVVLVVLVVKVSYC